MIDLHHDLLSIMYYSYIRRDYTYLDSWIKNFREDNVSGLLANLYFMNPLEMKEEIGAREINVLDMFKISTKMFKTYLPDEKVIFSIEGCDYIKDINELFEFGKSYTESGTGIGLYHVKDIVENHLNGNVTINKTKKGFEIQIRI